MNDDVLEENERSSIRGTLLGLASKLQVTSAPGAVNNIDPYMREVRIWVRDDMSSDAVKHVMQQKLGLKPMKASTVNKLLFRTPNCVYHSICLTRSGKGWLSAVETEE